MRSSALPIILADLESLLTPKIHLPSGEFYFGIHPYFLNFFKDYLDSKKLQLVFFSRFKITDSTTRENKKKFNIFNSGFYLDDIIKPVELNFPDALPCAYLDSFSDYILNGNFQCSDSSITAEQLKQALVISSDKSTAGLASSYGRSADFISLATFFSGELSRMDCYFCARKIHGEKYLNPTLTNTLLLSLDIDETLFLHGKINELIPFPVEIFLSGFFIYAAFWKISVSAANSKSILAMT